jgi:putative endonuclease
MTASDLGRWGEDVARAYLEERGWTIVAQNARQGRGEIDLIARRAEVLAFCEVKTRSEGERWGHPTMSVNWRKRLAVTRVARAWLFAHPQPRTTLRFDVISVVAHDGGPPIVEHFEDAWWGNGVR